MEIVSKLVVLLIFIHKLSSASFYAQEETHSPSCTHMLGRTKHFCNIPYLPVDTHSDVYAHGPYYLREQCVPTVQLT